MLTHDVQGSVVRKVNGHGFIGYTKGRNVDRALGFSLTGTVSTSLYLLQI